MKRLAAATGVAGVVTTALYLTPAPKPPDTALYDKLLLWGIAIGFITCAFVMLRYRRNWTPRAIGLFFNFAAAGLLFGNSVYIRYAGYHMETYPKGTMRGSIVFARFVSNADPGRQEAITDLTRALFIVGIPLIIYGSATWIWDKNHPVNELGIEDRRKDVRREEDRIMKAENTWMKVRLRELEERFNTMEMP